MVKFVHNCRVLCFHGLAHWAVRTPPPSRLCGWGEQDDHKLPCNTCATRTSKMSLLSSLLELQGSKQDSWGIFHLGFHAQVPRSCTFGWLYIAGFLIFELNLQKSALVEPRQQKVRLVWHGAEKQLSIHCSSQTTGRERGLESGSYTCILLVQPSPAAADQVFSILYPCSSCVSLGFRAYDQHCSCLQDYVENDIRYSLINKHWVSLLPSSCYGMFFIYYLQIGVRSSNIFRLRCWMDEL